MVRAIDRGRRGPTGANITRDRLVVAELFRVEKPIAVMADGGSRLHIRGMGKRVKVPTSVYNTTRLIV